MRLALGTVQFGLDYGVANAAGIVPRAEASRILAFARESGIDTLDTAASYGDSELVLGTLNVDGFRVVTKLPAEIPSEGSVSEWVRRSANASLTRLQQRNLYGMMLHRPSQLFEAGGEDIYQSLLALKSNGIVSKVGVSIYDPNELDSLFENFDFDLVQAPLSVVDRRMISSGWIGRLASRGIELHVRSVFLQGLLLMPAVVRPAKFNRWERLWCDWDNWLDESGLSATEACVRFALSYPEVGAVVVGVQSFRQLDEIVSAAAKGKLEAPPALNVNAENLLNPARWTSLI